MLVELQVRPGPMQAHLGPTIVLATIHIAGEYLQYLTPNRVPIGTEADDLSPNICARSAVVHQARQVRNVQVEEVHA